MWRRRRRWPGWGPACIALEGVDRVRVVIHWNPIGQARPHRWPSRSRSLACGGPGTQQGPSPQRDLLTKPLTADLRIGPLKSGICTDVGVNFSCSVCSTLLGDYGGEMTANDAGRDRVGSSASLPMTWRRPRWRGDGGLAAALAKPRLCHPSSKRHARPSSPGCGLAVLPGSAAACSRPRCAACPSVACA